MKNIQDLNIDLTSTTGVNTEDGMPIWVQGFLLREVPGQDALLPLSIWFNPVTGKINENTSPPELREELKTFSIPNNSSNPPSNPLPEPELNMLGNKETNDELVWDDMDDGDNTWENSEDNNEEEFDWN